MVGSTSTTSTLGTASGRSPAEVVSAADSCSAVPSQVAGPADSTREHGPGRRAPGAEAHAHAPAGGSGGLGATSTSAFRSGVLLERNAADGVQLTCPPSGPLRERVTRQQQRRTQQRPRPVLYRRISGAGCGDPVGVGSQGEFPGWAIFVVLSRAARCPRGGRAGQADVGLRRFGAGSCRVGRAGGEPCLSARGLGVRPDDTVTVADPAWAWPRVDGATPARPPHPLPRRAGAQRSR